MKEAILHYIWQSKLFYPHGLVTTDQEPVEIVNTGFRNTDAGPDFFNAKVKIGDTLWAGNVEIHVKSSDWYRHNHHTDKAYNSVVLHVVHEADAEVRSENGNRISQLILQYPPHIERNYEELMRQHVPIPCASKLHDVPSIFIRSWESTLLAERLAQKTAAIEQMLHDTHQHWEECFYVTLARNFGFGTNSDAFEALARSLPLNVLARHKDNLMQIEALLFGQAGLLPPTPPDDYARQLTDEYTFLQHKYQLSSRLDASRWKLLRLRPTNFPHVRIAQFAALIHSSSKLFSKILEQPDIEQLQRLFACTPSDYWTRHYTFAGASGARRAKALGLSSIRVILINTVAPCLFCYASHQGDQELKDRAVRLLEQLPPERNAVITLWSSLGIDCRSAYDTQALLQLKTHYCDRKDCIRCRIGHKVLAVRPQQANADT